MNKKSYKRGYRRTIIRLLLTSGCLSKHGIHMLGENTYVQYATKIKEMKEEGVIEEINVMPKAQGYHKTLRLKKLKPTSEAFMEELGAYAGHYYRYALENAKQISYSAKGKGIKAYRESEVVCMLYGTSVRIFPDEKIGIREKKKIPLYPPSFYNSLEVKEGGNYKLRIDNAKDDKTDATGSRIIGLIISEGGYYGIYHTEDKQIKWVKSSEGQITNTIAHFVNERCVNVSEKEKEETEKSEKGAVKNRSQWKDLPVEKVPKITNAILLGKNTDIFVKTFKNTAANKLNIYESGYEKLYSVPYSKEGQTLIELMTKKEWEEDLKTVYLNGLNQTTRTSSVTCDAIDEDKFILLFCIPDMIKLKKFLNSATYANEPEKFIIYCFDFQEEFVSKVSEELATVKYADFSEYCEYKGVKKC